MPRTKVKTAPTAPDPEQRTAPFAPQQRLAVRPKEAASMLGIGNTSLFALLKTGDLPCRRLGGATVILLSDLQKYVAGLPSGR